MSSDNGSQVASIDNTPHSRRELYSNLLALQNPGWKDDGKQVHKYLVDNINRIPPKEDTELTLVAALLNFYDCAGKEKKEVVDSVISDILSLMPDRLINETGGGNRDTPLHSAVSARNRLVIAKLIQKNPDFTAQNLRGKNPLHLAARAGFLTTVKELVSADSTGVSIFCQDVRAKTPILLACEHRHANTAKYLLKASPRAALIEDHNGYNALLMSARQGLLSVLETQLGRLERNTSGFPKDGEVSNDKTAVPEENGLAASSATQHGLAQAADIGLPNPSVLACQTENGHTVLHLACIYNHPGIVEFLLLKNADPTRTSKAGKSCLQVALNAGNFEISKRLLRETAVSRTLNQLDLSGRSMLSIACSQMQEQAVELLSNAGADCALPNRDFSTPISEAIASDRPGNLSILLCSSSFHTKFDDAVRFKTKEAKSSTALHLACQLGRQQCLELLLQHDVSPNLKDDDGKTVLHEASRLGLHSAVAALFEQSTSSHDVRVNELDHAQWSALHYASYQLSDNDKSYRKPDFFEDSNSAFESRNGPYEDILRHLLDRGADISLPNADGNLALHLAAGQGHANRVHQLLQYMPRVEDGNVDILQKLNKDRATPLACALRKRHPGVAKLLAEAMTEIQFHDTQEMEDEIFWLAERDQTREVISEILLKEKHTQSRRRLTSARRDPLVLAVIIGSAKLVLYLLLNSTPGPARDYSIKAAVGAAHEEREDYIAAHSGEFATGTEGGLMADAGNKSSTKVQDIPELQEYLKKYSDILDILHNPPATGRLGRRLVPASEPRYDEKSQPARFVDKYRVELVDCYDDSYLRRSASVKEAVYGVGPHNIMKATSQRTQELQAEFLGLEKPQGVVREKHPPNVLWIHLPANNIKWLEDVCLKVNSELKCDNEVTDWLSSSWEEVVGSGRETNYMKPLCSVRFDKSRPQPRCAAVYMPYVAPAWHCKNQDYDELLSHYQSNGCTVHGTRTLDEFFYHFCRMKGIRNTIDDRNQDQILSKALFSKDLRHLSTWVLVNVDQMWIWIPNKDTLVTSATHRRDSAYDPAFTATLEALHDAMHTNSKGPQDAFEMADLVMNTCINLLHRRFDVGVSPTATSAEVQDSKPPLSFHQDSASDSSDSSSTDSGTNRRSLPFWGSIGSSSASNSTDDLPNNLRRVCINEIFINATAEAAAQESELYHKFIATRGSKSRHSSAAGGHTPSSPKDRIKAAQLFREIKDIRDELKMLRVIAEYQRSVQTEFTALLNIKTRATVFKDVVEELADMDKAVEQIETAVNITLNLQQNATAIAQADAAVYQGQIVLLFTVVTIVFLPMSFFTSLFAVQVDSFLKTPPWAFGVILGVSSLISATLAGYAFYSNTVNAYFRRSWRRLRKLFKECVMVLLVCFAIRRPIGIRKSDSDDTYLEKYTTASSSSSIEVTRRRKSIWRRRRTRDTTSSYWSTSRSSAMSTPVHWSRKVAGSLTFRARRATRSATSSYFTTSSQSLDVPWYSRLPSYWPFGTRRATHSISGSSHTASPPSSAVSDRSSMHAVRWYSRALGHWPFSRTAETNLPVSASATTSGSSTSIERHPEIPYRNFMGMSPGSWVRGVRQWFMARWPRPALSEGSGSSSTTRSMSSLEASSPNIVERRDTVSQRRQRRRSRRY